MTKIQDTKNKIQKGFHRFVSWKLEFGPSSEAGFTLVEMLAVVSIFVIVGAIAMSILVTSFRTSQKTDIITLVQQNGNYALSQVAKTLRNARGLVTPFPCVGSVSTNSVTVITQGFCNLRKGI